MEERTIAAVATAPGEAGIAVVRVSGPRALEVAERIFRPRSGRAPGSMPGYTAAYGTVVDPDSEELLDDGILLVMRGPASYTGEDVVEFSVHGGLQPPQRVLAACCAAGAVVAEPGEFTRHAFLNGKLDLTQVEAIADLIQARSEQSLRISSRQRAGSLGRRLRKLTEAMDEERIALEAAFDFPEDVEFPSPQNTGDRLNGFLRELEAVERAILNGARVQAGFRVVLTGPPNVGKSTLFNALLEQERALVSEWPGTTRDTLDATLLQGGVALQLVDTAGIRESADPVEALGVARAQRAVEEADLLLEVREAAAWDRRHPPAGPDLRGVPRWTVLTKADLIDGAASRDAAALPSGVFRVSALTGEGIDRLRSALVERAASFFSELGEEAYLAGERQLVRLRQAADAVRRALQDLEEGRPPDLLATALAEARRALAEMLGESPDPEMLDRMFERFCIGK